MMTLLSLFLLRALPMITRHSIATLLSLLLFYVVPAAGQEVKGPTGLPAGQTMGGVTTANLVCDGVTDNAPLLTTLMTSAASSNGTIYIPPAKNPCMMASNVTVPDGVDIIAWPGSIVLKAKTGNTSSPLLVNIQNNPTGNNIYGVTFDGGGYGTSAFASTNNVNQVFNSSNVIFDNVKIQNTSGAGIVFSTTTNSSGIRNSVFTNVGITQATFTGTISGGTTLTVNSGLTGTILAGAVISCTGCSYQETVVSGSGTSWTVTSGNNVGPVTMTATFGKQGAAFCCGVVLGNSSISGTTLTTGSSVSGIIGQYVYGIGVHPDTIVTGGSGTSWTVSVSQTVASTSMTAALNKANFVTSTVMTNIGLDGVSYTQEHDFTVRLNNITYAGISSAAGIYDHFNDTTLITGNIIQNTGGNGLDLAGTANAVITGNSIKFSGGAGIAYAWASHATISGNVSNSNYLTVSTTTNPAQAGLFLSGTQQAVTDITITGNDFSDLQTTPTQAYGVQMQAASTYSNIKIDGSNIMRGNTLGMFGGALSDFTIGQTSDNRIRNPCFAVDQTNEGAVYAHGGGNRQIQDGWLSVQSVAMGTNIQSTAITFPGCGPMGNLTTVTDTGTPGAGDLNNLQQRMEGADFQDLQWGTANAKALILQFCMQSNLAGTNTWPVVLIHDTKYYATTYQATANTLTCPSIIIPGDTATAISNLTTQRVTLIFDQGGGSTTQTSTLNAWTVGSSTAISGTVSLITKANNTTQTISSVRLYPASGPLGFIPKTFQAELERAQRYYQKTFPIGTAVGQNKGVAGCLSAKVPIATSDPAAWFSFPVPMRASPSITTYNPSVTNANWRDITAGADVTVSVDPAVAVSNSTGVLIATSGTVATLGDILCIHATADARL